MARRLRAETRLLHLLNEATLRITCRRLGLLRLHPGARKGDLFTLRKSRQLLVLLAAVRVYRAEAGRLQDIAGRDERLASDLDGNAGSLDDSRFGKRREKTARDEVVQLEFRRRERIGRRDAGRIDGRMVGLFLLATRRLELALLQELLAIGAIGRIAGKRTHDLCKIERSRIDRVVDTRIGNVAVHVQALGQTHRTTGRNAFSRSRGHQRGGIERRRGRNATGFLLDVDDDAARVSFNMVENRLSGFFRLETTRLMHDIQIEIGGIELPVNNPVVFGHKRKTLAFLGDDQREGRRLHTACRAHVAVAAKLHKREIAGQRSAPDEVDVLTRFARHREIEIKLDEMREGVGYLLLGHRRITGAVRGNLGVRLANHRQRVHTDKLAFAVEVGRDHNAVRLLRKVLQRADDVLFLGKLFDGSVNQIRQSLHLPALQIDAVSKERLALGFVRRFCQRLGKMRLERVPFGIYTPPAAALPVFESGGEIGFKDMAAQADDGRLFPVHFAAVHRGRIHLVALGLA